MADNISTKPWDGSPSQWPDAAAFCRACLIDENETGQPKTKALCKLPYREPEGGAPNVNAIHAAAAALAGGRGGVQATPASKKAAAKRLLALYAQMKEDAPPSIKNMAM